MDELRQLKNIIVDLDEAITHSEEKGLAYLPYYTNLLKRRRIILKAIKRLEKLNEDDMA